MVFSNVRACPDASLELDPSTAKYISWTNMLLRFQLVIAVPPLHQLSASGRVARSYRRMHPFPHGAPTLAHSLPPLPLTRQPSARTPRHQPAHTFQAGIYGTMTCDSMGAHGSSNELGGSSGHGKDFLSLLEARTVMPEMLDDFSSAACDYLKGMDGSDYNSISGSASYGFDSGGPYAGPSALPVGCDGIASSPPVYLGNSTLVQESMMGCMPSHNHEARTGTGQGGAAGDPKNRKSEEKLGGNGKRSKKDTSSRSPPKAEVPDMKLGERDKIIALQQIISPYGKTDRASVLYETIKHIEYLHEQIQLLSEPYMKNSTNEVPFQWGGKEENLRGRGLCLVPVSCTPQVFQDNSLPDCWMPAYKSSRYQ
ncbi:transcription factor SPATULA-like isoform X5 [Hordeum vulgare subsp. vulgare]|uniref:transcription factor SPATULA-like isoform X5 n=1 Tax=Hordeum vulgare subsp. vulgare TaxID=112509 RepID=UPI001D1A3341|nr:transcription factor SPATULA-like isoform X5 [Hordeum vulgare subsp. vulgare]